MDNILIKNWEDLRKQARYFENELDVKLVAFSKLGTNIKSTQINFDTIPLLDDEHVFDNMATEIESLLSKLILVNEKLSEIHVNEAAMLHTIQRHKDIFMDYKLEFNKIRDNHETRRMKDLLDEDLSNKNYTNVSGLNRRDMYLKENQFIHNSDRLINDQISIAMDTRDHLISQRHTFKHIQTRFNNVSSGLPIINSLMHKINLRKRRDSLIVGLLVSFCTIMILFYTFH